MNLHKRALFAQLYRAPMGGGDSGGGAAVVKNESGEAEGTGNDARVALLNKIADQSELEVEDQLADVNDDDTTTPFKSDATRELTPEEEESASAAAEAEVEAARVAAADAAKEEEPARKFKIKVNGKEIELTEDELIARAQKVESADEYLRTAKNTVREPAKPAGPTAEDLQRQQDVEDRALVRAIQMGNEDEATAAIRKIRTQTTVARPSINMDDVSRTIDERLEFKSAYSAFEKEFSDVIGDSLLMKLMLDKDSEQLAAGDTRPYLERYRENGNELRAWVAKKAPVVEKPLVADMADKKARKDALPVPVATASAKAKQVVEETDDGEEDATGVIANMAKRRGGPQWMRN